MPLVIVRLRREYRRFLEADASLRWKLSTKYLCFALQQIFWTLMWLLLSPFAWVVSLFGVRFLYGSPLPTRLGHLALEPYLYVKSGILHMRKPFKAILLAPKKIVVNPSLLNYWRPFIRIIDHPFWVSLLTPLSGVWFLRYHSSPDEDFSIQKRDGSLLKGGPAQDEIELQYGARFGNRPILTLTWEHSERGWRYLNRLGVPQDAWFACLHVREPGYLSHLAYHSYRDADIGTYHLAIKEIVARGGWVVRVGDPSMKRLPEMDRVIDYAHSSERSDWLDIFLLGECRFIVGTTSGAWVVSFVFGKPVVCTNQIPMGHGVRSAKDIYIPKLYRSVGEDRILTFKEVLLSPLRDFSETVDYVRQGLTWVDNTEEEIRAATREMLDRLEGKQEYTDRDQLLQAEYKRLLTARPTVGTISRVGREFLRKFDHLLMV